MKPTENDLTVLRAFNVCGSMTVKDLLLVRPQLGDDYDAKTTCERLYSGHYLNVQRMPGRPAIYEIAYKGKRAILGKPQMGDFPAPRSAPTNESYKPKPIAVREGAMRAFELPSRRGGELVEHRLPISLAGA